MLVSSVLRAGWAAAIAALAGVGCGQEADLGLESETAASDQPPHIVLIVADDLGYGDLGWTGGAARTPTLDGLAESSLRLTRFHAFPLCSPSRAALLTGRSPLRYGLAWSPLRPWSEKGLPSTEHTLPEALQAAGYETALIGKWHLGHHAKDHHPNQHGFDTFYGFLTGAVDYYSKESRDGGVDWQRDGETEDETAYATGLLSHEAVALIHGHDVSRPLFLMLSYSAPHRPMQAPKEALTARMDLSDPAEQVYAAMVEEMDRGIAQVLDALEQRDMRTNTILVFLSDNGGALNLGANNGPYRGGKSVVYQGGLRVPAVLSWPDAIDSSTWSGFASVLDLGPSLASLAGATLGDDLDGRDLSHAWLDSSLRVDELAPETVFVAHNAERGQMAIFSEQWKFVRRIHRDQSTQAREQLFDIRADPEEKNNLLQQHPEIAGRLREALAQWLALDPSGSSLDRLPAWDGNAPQNWKAPAEWAGALR